MTENRREFRKRALQREALAGLSTFCFPVSCAFVSSHQERVRSWCRETTRDVDTAYRRLRHLSLSKLTREAL
jgi:hypothetical protein